MTIIKTFLLFILIIGIVIGIYFLFFKIKKESDDLLYNKNKDNLTLKENYRNIFCYWDTENLPSIVNECLKKIKKEMGNKWNIILLNKNTIHNLIPVNDFPKNYEKLKIQAKTDWIRLYLLKNYGGLWIDISIVLNDPQEIEDLYDIIMNTNKNICLYEMDFHRIKVNNKEYPGIESWFIIAKPNNELIINWLNEFEYAIEIGFDNYSKYINKNNYILSPSCKIDNYLTSYKCIQVVMQKYNINLNDVYIKNARETFYKLYDNIKNILENKCNYNIKLARYDRDYLDKHLKKFIEMYFD